MTTEHTLQWDLVTRLREGRTNGSHLQWFVTDTCREAADEIERLRAVNADLLAALKDWMRDGDGWNLTELRKRYDENTVQRFLRSEAAIDRAEHGDYT